MNRRTSSQRGFGLIEALVVVLVIAVGLLALAGFHGDLMASSGLTKARAEALMLARAKLEELTNNIQIDQFNTSLADTTGSGFSTPEETLTGKNAAFGRSWRIEDLDNVSTIFKKAMVRVVWADPRARDERVWGQNITISGQRANQQVLLNDMIAFSDPATPGVLAPPAAGSPGARGVNPKRSGKKGPGMEEGADLVPGDYTLSLADLKSADAAKFKWQFNTKGNVVLLENVGSNTWIVRYTFFGQSIQTVTGKVYYDDPTNLNFVGLAVFASEPAYCAAFPYGTEECPKCKKGVCTYTTCASVGAYACFFSGDCEHGGDNCTTFNPTGGTTYTGLASLDGGWYGKIGIAGLDKSKAVCQADIDATTSTKNYAREYINVRDLGGGQTKWEGINQSFECQNFVVGAEDTAATCTTKINDYSASPPEANIGLPASKVRRGLATAAVNTAQPRLNFWCSSRNIVIQGSSSPGNVGGATASGATTNTWPEEECVAWELNDGFSCSVPAGSPVDYSDDWTGTLYPTNKSGGSCASISWGSTNWGTPPENPASVRVTQAICP